MGQGEEGDDDDDVERKMELEGSSDGQRKRVG